MNIEESTILVVDDKPANLNVLLAIFDDMQYDVLCASDGKMGLDILKEECPDLILLDVMMPGIDGFETCQRIKSNPKTADIPIIFMTALSDTGDIVKGFELGAVDYITKPIRQEEVLVRVKTHLTLHKMYTMLADREVHLRHLVEEKTRTIEHITMALVKALENANMLNDEDTGRHIQRVGEYAALLSEYYGCPPSFVKRIKLYAPLHDVGKVGLPDSILQKVGPYTQSEYIKMQQHVKFGADLLENEGLDIMARNIALYHHEKWDGTGYMQRLAGEAIPLEARIVALADVYDALTSPRIYKKAFSQTEAQQKIRNESGKHFDPQLVNIFLDHVTDIIHIQTLH